MTKMIVCSHIDFSSGCKHILLGNTEEDVLRKAAEHAKEHGLHEITPEMMQRLRVAIRECPWKLLERNR